MVVCAGSVRPGRVVMLLDVSRLRGVERLDRKFEPSTFAIDSQDFRLAAPVELTGEVRKDGRNVRLAGRLKTTIECACSRCLDAYKIPVDVPLDLLFLPAGANMGPATDPDSDEAEIGEDDLGVSFYRNDVIDLTEVMREQFYLALPMKPLCREDCKGLCAQCGTNLNTGTCDCAPVWEDPRLAALKAIKGKNA